MKNNNKKILIHTCCAVCSGHSIKHLKELGFEPIAYFFNPKICAENGFVGYDSVNMCRCPAEDPPYETSYTGFSFCGYPSGEKMSAIKKPESRARLCDGAGAIYPAWGASYDVSTRGRYRHVKGMNILFFDQHVERGKYPMNSRGTPWE